MKNIIYEFLLFLYEFLIPRFVYDEVAIIGDPRIGDFEILCITDDLLDFDHYEFTGMIKSFSWLGFGFFGELELNSIKPVD